MILHNFNISVMAWIAAAVWACLSAGALDNFV
jgi:hypothetical protein